LSVSLIQGKKSEKVDYWGRGKYNQDTIDTLDELSLLREQQGKLQAKVDAQLEALALLQSRLGQQERALKAAASSKGLSNLGSLEIPNYARPKVKPIKVIFADLQQRTMHHVSFEG